MVETTPSMTKMTIRSLSSLSAFLSGYVLVWRNEEGSEKNLSFSIPFHFFFVLFSISFSK